MISALIIENAIDERHELLSATESRAILTAFHVPTAPSVTVSSAAETLS